jgi:hypothetical protein
MDKKGIGNLLNHRFAIWIFLCLGIVLIAGYSRFNMVSEAKKLPVRVVLKNGETVLTYTNGVSSKTIKTIKRAFEKKPVRPDTIIVYGKLLIERTDLYDWDVKYSRAVSFWIDGKPVIQSTESARSGPIHLTEGFHDFRMVLSVEAGRDDLLKIYWKHSGFKKWKSVRQAIFMAPDKRAGTAKIKEIRDIQKRNMLVNSIMQVFNYLFIILFLILGMILTRQPSDIPATAVVNEKRHISYSRIKGIDVTKGFAAFLMVTGHSSGAIVLLPFADFGADLFFFCSGMNTYLFLNRFKRNRGITVFHLFFSALLFFGGYTQIVIAHPGERRLIPAFLQFIALGMILIFILIKFLKNARWIGYMFFIPFLLHFCYKFNWLPFLRLDTHWRTFVLGETGFALFPWAGFLFYGIFILNLRKNQKAVAALLLTSGISSILLIVVAGIPVTRYDMSLSYVMLSLFVLTLLFFIFDRMTVAGSRFVPAVFQNNLALVGRNALMFVYVHYFILRYLVPRVPDFSAVAELLFQGLLAFVFCIFFIFIYEKIKFDDSLFSPMLIFLIFLLVSRYAGLFVANIDFNLIDMVAGIVFAFVYIELRRKFKGWVKPIQQKI